MNPDSQARFSISSIEYLKDCSVCKVSHSANSIFVFRELIRIVCLQVLYKKLSTARDYGLKCPCWTNKFLLKSSKSLAKRSTFVELNFGSFLIFLDNSNPKLLASYGVALSKHGFIDKACDNFEKSISIELIRDLLTLGVQISAFDPKVNILPKDLSMVRLENTIDDVTIDSDLLIVVTRWPDFQALSSETLINNMRAPVVIDQGAFLVSGLSGESRIQYIAFGKG